MNEHLLESNWEDETIPKYNYENNFADTFIYLHQHQRECKDF